MTALDRLVHVLSRAVMGVAGVALMLMMIQTVVDVIGRNVFSKPIEGSLEVVSVYHMVAVVFLPLALVERRHEHISVDLLVNSMPAVLRRLFIVLSYLVCAIFAGVLAYQTAIDAVESFKIGEILMSSIYITVWPAKFMLPIGFGLMFLQFLLHAWSAITDPGFNPEPDSPGASSEARN